MGIQYDKTITIMARSNAKLNVTIRIVFRTQNRCWKCGSHADMNGTAAGISKPQFGLFWRITPWSWSMYVYIYLIQFGTRVFKTKNFHTFHADIPANNPHPEFIVFGAKFNIYTFRFIFVFFIEYYANGGSFEEGIFISNYLFYDFSLCAVCV